VDYSPQNGFVPAPGNNNGYYGTQADSGSNINGNHIAGIRSAITGIQKDYRNEE
jgi:hypothetical protein